MRHLFFYFWQQGFSEIHMLHLAHNTHYIATPYFTDILFRVATFDKLKGDFTQLANILAVGKATATVKIGPDTHMINLFFLASIVNLS